MSLSKHDQSKVNAILERHIALVEKEGVTYEERRKQAERERFDQFVLSVGSLLHSVGMKYTYEGTVGAKPALNRVKKLKRG